MKNKAKEFNVVVGRRKGENESIIVGGGTSGSEVKRFARRLAGSGNWEHLEVVHLPMGSLCEFWLPNSDTSRLENQDYSLYVENGVKVED